MPREAVPTERTLVKPALTECRQHSRQLDLQQLIVFDRNFFALNKD